MKLVVFVEGETERDIGAFLRRCLDLHGAPRVSIPAIRLKGWTNYRAEIAKKAALQLATPEVLALGLIDLHGPDFVPRTMATVGQRYRWLKEHFETAVGRPNFVQHFAVHETEAWFLACPDLLPDFVRNRLPAAAVSQPEGVNLRRPPARLLGGLYARRGRTYKKSVEGRNLLARLDPVRVKDRCPFFAEMIDDVARRLRGMAPR